MKSDDIIEFIDNTIMVKLNENNIFEKFRSLEEIRHKLIYTVYDVNFEDLTQKECDGFWSPSAKRLVIDKKLENPITQKNEVLRVKIHELLHALTTKFISNVEERWGIQQITNSHWFLDEKGQRVDIPFEEKGRGLNEGITEYLAQKLCPEENYKYDEKGITFNISGVYPLEQIMTKELAIFYGEDKIIDAYINNKDIEIPEEIYKQLRRSFDHIDDKDSYIRNKRQGRSWQTLSPGERAEIILAESNIAETFKEAQQYFLENCLQEEINKITTKEQALELAVKLRKLNSLNIKVEGNKEANYQHYNFSFARKYLRIVNKDKTYNEQVKFDEILKYLVADTEQELKVNKSITSKMTKFFSKAKTYALSFLPEHETRFTAIDIANGVKSYIREIGKEVIMGQDVFAYQYLTEDEYEKYQNGDKTVRGEILRGNIELKRISKDKEYSKEVGNNMLSPNRIEDKLINSNGYIGYVGEDNKTYLEPNIREVFEETTKYIGVDLEGFKERMYICEIESNNEKIDVKKYALLTKDEMVKSREREFQLNQQGIIIQGEIDLERVQQDKKYRTFLEQKFLPKERIKMSKLIYGGYVGEIIDIGDVYKTYTNPRYLEALAIFGANGEERIEEEVETVVKGEKSKETIRYYLKKGEKTGEKDRFGFDIYSYEFIPSIEMQKMWADKNYANTPERERIIIKASKIDIEWHLKHERIKEAVVYKNGYIGVDSQLIEKNSNNHIEATLANAVLWEMNGDLYVARNSERAFDNRKKIYGNLNIEQINSNPEYKKIVLENILTQSSVDNIIITGKYNNIEFDEVTGNFKVDKKFNVARRLGHDLVF